MLQAKIHAVLLIFLSENRVDVYELNGRTVINITGNFTKEQIEEKISSCSCFDR